MSEFKGTPGPWICAANKSFFDIGPDHRKVEPNSCMAVYPSACIGVGFEQEANAHLIAAAPEMLEALLGLQELLMGYCSDCGCGTDTDEWRVASKAIAKALGEEHDQ